MKKNIRINSLRTLSLCLIVITITIGFIFYQSKVYSTEDEVNGQTGRATVVLRKSGGDLNTVQNVAVGINAGILRQQIMSDLAFAKIVITYDPGLIELVSDPQLFNSDWQYPVFVQSKSEAESKNPGKIILVAGISQNQDPINANSQFAKLQFKKKSPNLNGTAVINVDINDSQIINTPAQEAIITVQNLSLPL